MFLFWGGILYKKSPYLGFSKELVTSWRHILLGFVVLFSSLHPDVIFFFKTRIVHFNKRGLIKASFPEILYIYYCCITQQKAPKDAVLRLFCLCVVDQSRVLLLNIRKRALFEASCCNQIVLEIILLLYCNITKSLCFAASSPMLTHFITKENEKFSKHV